MDVLIQLVRIALGITVCIATYELLTIFTDLLASKR